MVSLVLFLILMFAANVALLVTGADEQREHDWRRCLKCPSWFNKAGITVHRPPWITRFAVHEDGLCPICRKKEIPGLTRARARGGDEQSFAA